MKKNPLCLAPWVGLYTSPHGLAPCCHIAPMDDYTLEEYHNSDFLVELRRAHEEHDLEALDWRCKVCIRKKYTLYGEMGYGKDPVITKQWDEGKRGFMHLNVAISSKCSMSCKMCLISDKRFVELREHGPEVLGLGPKTIDYMESDFDVAGLAEEHKDTLRYTSFFGGDPAMHVTTPTIMNLLNPETIVRYSCNGKMEKLIDGQDLYDALEKFERVSLSFSIDAVGDLGKYIRGGIDYKRFDKLYKVAAGNEAKFWTGISFTVSLWNIMRLCEEFDAIYDKYVAEYGHILIFVTPVLEPTYAAIQNLPFSLRRKLRVKAKQYIDGLKEDSVLSLEGERKLQMFRDVMTQIDDAMSASFNKEGWGRFKYMEQQHELKHGYNIKEYISEYKSLF